MRFGWRIVRLGENGGLIVVFIWLVLFCLDSSFNLRGDETDRDTAKPVTVEQLRIWVAELGDDSFQKRKSATESLMKVGPAAIDVLEAAKESDNREVRSRAQTIIEKLTADAVAHLEKLDVSLTPKRSLKPIWLNAMKSRITDADLIHVSCLRTLVKIRLDNRPIGDEGLAHLHPLVGVTKLSVRNTKVSDAGLSNLTSWPLEDVNVDGCAISNLAWVAKMTNLKAITLNDTKISDGELIHLKALPKLLGVSLDRTKVTGVGLAQLRPHSKQLRYISLCGTAFSDDDLKRLKGFDNLHILYLDGTKVSSDGLKHIHELPRLDLLTLRDTSMDDRAFIWIKKFAALTSLNLSGTEITAEGLATLGSATQLETIMIPDYIGGAKTTMLKQTLKTKETGRTINLRYE